RLGSKGERRLKADVSIWILGQRCRCSGRLRKLQAPCANRCALILQPRFQHGLVQAAGLVQEAQQNRKLNRVSRVPGSGGERLLLLCNSLLHQQAIRGLALPAILTREILDQRLWRWFVKPRRSPLAALACDSPD